MADTSRTPATATAVSETPRGSEAAPAPPGLTGTELRRRMWHILPGFLPFILWPIPHRDPLSPTLTIVVLTVCAVIGAMIYLRYGDIARSGDRGRLPAVLGYVGSVALTLLLFPAHAELAFTVLAILAFGDGSATTGGLLLGGPRLPWNSCKSWSGLVCFIAVGVPMAALVYWGEANNLEALGPAPGLATALAISGAAVVTAGFAESMPSRINDNIRVGIAAAVTLIAGHAIMVGLHQ